MIKKIFSLFFTVALIGIIIYNVGNYCSEVRAETTNRRIGGSSSGASAYTHLPPGIKQVDRQSFLLICQAMSYQNSQSPRSFKALPQSHRTSELVSDMFATSGNLTYTFCAGFDERLVNDIPSGFHTTVRFGPVDNYYYTDFSCLYYYY